MGNMWHQYPWSRPVPCDCGSGGGGGTGEGMSEQEVKNLIEDYLAHYMTSADVDTKLIGYLKSSDLATALSNYMTKEEIINLFSKTATVEDITTRIANHSKLKGYGQLGHVNTARRTPDMTKPVGIDDNGGLWTSPDGGESCGLNPVQKTADMTQPVGRDGNGFLWTKPGEGGGGSVNLPFYNALDYGVNAAAADNTTALQNLFDMVYQNGGGTVVLPAGVLKVKQLTVKGKTSIIGQGMQLTTLLCIGTNGLTGVLNMDVNSMGSRLQDFCINGGSLQTDGLYWKGQNHDEGRLDLDYYTTHNPGATEKVKYKMAMVEHVMVTKCGNFYEEQGHQMEFNHFGINQELQANYNVIYNGCWIFRNENGFRIVSSDGYITECTIEGNAFVGYYNLGGNWKITDTKIIWNGWSGIFGVDGLYAVVGKAQSEGNPTGGRCQMSNVEFQDNLCKDMYLEGNNHVINALFDNSRYEGVKTGTLTMHGVKHSNIQITFSHYIPVGDPNPTLIITDEACEKNFLVFPIHPQRCVNVGTINNEGGQTFVLK